MPDEQPELFDCVPLEVARSVILKQKEFRDAHMVELITPKDGEFDPFADDEATAEAIARHEARRAGHKFKSDVEVGFQAFTPKNKTIEGMVSDWAEHGDAEKTGGKPKRKTVNDNKLIKDYLRMLWPDAIEIRYEETWETTWSGMRIKKDRDGFIDFSIQFRDRAEIAIQATTGGAEAAHLKKMLTRGRKAGDNCHRWLKNGRKLYMVLCDASPGKKHERYNWTKVGKYQRVACIYEVTLEMLAEKREKLAKLAAGREKRAKDKKR